MFTEPGFEMSPYTKQGAKITPQEGTAKSFFGSDVAMSADGNTIFAGASNDNSGIGAAWVFTRESFKWKQQGSKITAEGEVGPAGFGVSVALSADGNTAVIGASGEDRPSEFLEEAGSAWGFTRSEGTWTQHGGKLTGSGDQHEGTALGAQFGNDVALSADAETALIGGFTDNAEVGAGAAWIFSTATGPVVKEEPETDPTGRKTQRWRTRHHRRPDRRAPERPPPALRQGREDRCDPQTRRLRRQALRTPGRRRHDQLVQASPGSQTRQEGQTEADPRGTRERPIQRRRDQSRQAQADPRGEAIAEARQAAEAHGARHVHAHRRGNGDGQAAVRAEALSGASRAVRTGE